jgi:CheY-like chemotaxis protein
MRVLLPLQPGAQESPIPDVHARGGEVKGRGTVLVVDDEPLVLRIAARALEELGYRVFTAADGQSAVQTFGANRVDAVVLDLVMPVMDGFEFLEELQHRPILSNVPVVVLTAKELSPEEIAVLTGRTQRIMTKQATSNVELVAAIRKSVRRHLDQKQAPGARSARAPEERQAG